MALERELNDFGTKDIQRELLVPNAVNKEAYLKFKLTTPARLGVYRAGSRYKTRTFLRLRADHGAAQDAVLSCVSEQFLKEMDLFKVKTLCKNKDEYLKRPDLGRALDKNAIEKIQDSCKMKPQVQIYISDGLSSAAIEANVKNTLPALMQGLRGYDLDIGTVFFLEFGRVGASDHISEIVGPLVTCVLIGERPGLATASSMSAYITYKGYIGIPETKRTVVSNIHKNGTPSAEAGAYIADIIKAMIAEG